MHCYYYQSITIFFVLFYFLLLTIMPFLAGSLLFARNRESLNLTSCKKGFLERMHLFRNLDGRTYDLGTFRTGQSLVSTLSVMEFSPFAHLLQLFLHWLDSSAYIGLWCASSSPDDFMSILFDVSHLHLGL